MRRRGALLVPAAALAVHQLRYTLAFGPDARHVLAEQGHAYLHSLTPWIVLALCVAFGRFLGRAAAGRDATTPAPVWLLATGGLIAIYAGQELLEGLLSSGHPPGFAGVFGEGGWLAVPSAALIGFALTLALRTADAVVAAITARRRLPHFRNEPSTTLKGPGPLRVVEGLLMARHLAGRAPPRFRMDPVAHP